MVRPQLEIICDSNATSQCKFHREVNQNPGLTLQDITHRTLNSLAISSPCRLTLPLWQLLWLSDFLGFHQWMAWNIPNLKPIVFFAWTRGISCKFIFQVWHSRTMGFDHQQCGDMVDKWWLIDEYGPKNWWKRAFQDFSNAFKTRTACVPSV